MADIKIFKLVNGDEILADTLSELLTGYKIKNPVRIVIIPNKADPKTPQVGFAPWAEWSSDTTFDLDKSAVICRMTPVKQFIDQYTAMFSPIIQKQGGLIL